MDSDPKTCELVCDWIKDLQYVKGEYKEPILNTQTVVFMKTSCDDLGQDLHVFFHAIEVLDRYVRAKNEQKVQLEDPLLVACTCILTSSKYQGGSQELTLKHIKTYLHQISCQEYTSEIVSSMENDILTTLINNSKIPVTTIFDDLDTLVEKFLIDYNTREMDLLPACSNILVIVMLLWKKLFANLKKLYESNETSKQLFCDLISSKLCIPLSVLMITLTMEYGDNVNTDAMLDTFSRFSGINYDDLKLMFNKMTDLVCGFLVKNDIEYSTSWPSFYTCSTWEIL